MRYPEFLKPGGTIGFVAPSFGCNIEPYKSAFLNAQKKWKEMGYETDLGPNCYEGKGIGISNTPKACGEELTEYYCSTQNDILISCGGGELMCETLCHVDFEKIKKAAPKWYLGYSDNTNMTFLLATLCDVASVYGPCAAAFGMEPWHPAIADTFDLLCGEKQEFTSYDMWEKEGVKDAEHPLLPYNCTEKTEVKIFTPQKTKAAQNEAEKAFTDTFGMQEALSANAEGRLLGGCMDCLVNLTGTRFDKVTEFAEKYKEDGILWFLEACDLNVFSIRRAMWQMDQAGWFKYVKGFIIGRPLQGDEMMGLDKYEAVLACASKYQVPVFMDVDLGHLPPAMPFVTGSYTRAEGKDGKMRISAEYRD